MSIIITLGTVLLILAAILGLYRVLKGPEAVDRVLALDFLSIVGIAVILLYAIFMKDALALDIALCLALIGFITAYIYSVSES